METISLNSSVFPPGWFLHSFCNPSRGKRVNRTVRVHSNLEYNSEEFFPYEEQSYWYPSIGSLLGGKPPRPPINTIQNIVEKYRKVQIEHRLKQIAWEGREERWKISFDFEVERRTSLGRCNAVLWQTSKRWLIKNVCDQPCFRCLDLDEIWIVLKRLS